MESSEHRLGDTSGAAPSPPDVRRAVRSRVAVLVVAIGVGLLLQLLLRHHLADLQARAADDPIAARAQLAGEVRVGGLALFGLTALLGVAWTATAIQGWRVRRFPPSRSWLWGGNRIFTGVQARWVAAFGVVLGTALVACSVAGASITLEMVTRLLTCRAR